MVFKAYFLGSITDKHDVVVAELLDDGPGEDGDGNAGNGAHGQRDAHEELGGAEVLQKPDGKT